MCIILFPNQHGSDQYVLSRHDPLSHLVIDVSSCMRSMHTYIYARTDSSSWHHFKLAIFTLEDEQNRL